MEFVITLGALKDATGHEAVTRYLEEQVLPGSDWNLVKVRRKHVRLEPPHAYWASYVVRLGRGELVYPEPDAEPVLDEPPSPPAGAAPANVEAAVKVELARYLPEIAAILRYDIETVPDSAARTIFGKVQPFNRGAESHRVMTEIWKAAQRSEGRLVVPKPLGYHPELGLYLQSSVPGKPISSDRTKPEFLPAIIHAAEALATLHESAIPTQKKLPLEREISRMERTLDQFALVEPRAYFLLRELVTHLRGKLKNLPEEEWLPTHGDYKYDQLLHEDGRFSLIDFDFFALAENSYDLGKFCAYLVPSMPKSWEQSVAAEEGRKAFLNRYRELRPQASLHRFPIYETVNLAGRAMTLMWTQMRGWEQAAEALLVIGMERLKSRLP